MFIKLSIPAYRCGVMASASKTAATTAGMSASKTAATTAATAARTFTHFSFPLQSDVVGEGVEKKKGRSVTSITSRYDDQ